MDVKSFSERFNTSTKFVYIWTTRTSTGHIIRPTFQLYNCLKYKPATVADGFVLVPERVPLQVDELCQPVQSFRQLSDREYENAARPFNIYTSSIITYWWCTYMTSLSWWFNIAIMNSFTCRMGSFFLRLFATVYWKLKSKCIIFQHFFLSVFVAAVLSVAYIVHGKLTKCLQWPFTARDLRPPHAPCRENSSL